MLLFGGYGREDGAGSRQTHVLCILLDVGLANSRETEKPQHAIGDAFQDLKRGAEISNKLKNKHQQYKPTQKQKICSRQVCQTYISPHLQCRRVNLVELVEIAVNDSVLRQAVLRASRHNNGTGHLLPSGSFVINLEQRRNKRC